MTRNSLNDCVYLAKREIEKLKNQPTDKDLIWILNKTAWVLSRNFQVLDPNNVFIILSVETLKEGPFDDNWINVSYLVRMVNLNWNVLCKKLNYDELFEVQDNKVSIQTKHITRWSIVILEKDLYRFVWKMDYIEISLRDKNYKNMWLYYLRKLFWAIKWIKK